MRYAGDDVLVTAQLIDPPTDSHPDRAKVREWLDMAIERQEPDAGYYEIVNVRLNAFGHPMLEEPEFRELRAKLGPL